MFGKQTAAILRWFIVCTILTSVSSINQSIGSLVTPSSVYPAPVELYRAETSNGATCILLQADGLVEVNFKSPIGDETYDSYMPANPRIEANCLSENTATMTLSWGGYSLFWSFEKTSGGERWYVNKLELTVSKTLKLQIPVDTFKLVHDQTLFSTPVGKSYTCEESIVQLVPPDPKSSPTGLHGTLFLREFRLQPFIYRGSTFSPPFECNAQLGFRDATATIAAGCTLAIAVLMTVTGYGIFRYFKIKKQQSEYISSTLAIAVLMAVTGYGIYRYFKIKKVQYKTMESPTRLFFITNALPS